MRDVRIAVNAPETITRLGLAQIRRRLREYRGELWQWLADYNLVALTTPHRTLAPNEDVHSELLATCYALFIICSRLMSAMSTDLIEVLEDEAVTHATQMLKLEKDVSSVNNWASFYIGQKLVVAKATLSTTSIWRENSGRCSSIIEEYKFKTWWAAITMEQPCP